MNKFKTLYLFIPALLSCSSHIEPIQHNYHETKNALISWNDVFVQDEEDYLVYFYSERCGHCNEIKQDIISFYLEDIITMYFVCTDYYAVIGQNKDLIGIDDINDFYIVGTPSLIRIYDHKISYVYAGSEEVKGYISILKI